MPGPPSDAPDWPVRPQAHRRRPLRIADLIGAVVLSAVGLGLIRFAAGVLDGPPLGPLHQWLAALAFVLVGAGLGATMAVGLNRLAESLRLRARGNKGRLASAATKTAALLDLAALALLMLVALVVTLFLVISALIFGMSPVRAVLVSKDRNYW